jgi:hypothetical protein
MMIVRRKRPKFRHWNAVQLKDYPIEWLSFRWVRSSEWCPMMEEYRYGLSDTPLGSITWYAYEHDLNPIGK